jgi:hypothetical protein
LIRRPLGHRRSRHGEAAPRPTRHFGGERNNDGVGMSSREKPTQPLTAGFCCGSMSARPNGLPVSTSCVSTCCRGAAPIGDRCGVPTQIFIRATNGSVTLWVAGLMVLFLPGGGEEFEGWRHHLETMHRASLFGGPRPKGHSRSGRNVRDTKRFRGRFRSTRRSGIGNRGNRSRWMIASLDEGLDVYDERGTGSRSRRRGARS